MSFAINRGLFKFNIIDHHAILGASLDANAKQIRLRYLKIAQKLHPDTCKGDPSRKKIASQFLSKLVNPAYEELSRKNSFAEHQLILTQIGKMLAKKKDTIAVNYPGARELLAAGNKLELLYPKLLKSLVDEQYKSLTEITTTISDISELNLVYLMLKYERGLNREDIATKRATPPPAPPRAKPPSSSKAKAKQPKAAAKPPSEKNPPPVAEEEPTPESKAASYIRRAKQYIEKKDFDRAITELRDALKRDPNSSQGHALMGKAYIQKNQLTMAKVHINKAYKANPKDPLVIESKKELDKISKKQNKSKSSSSNKKPDNKSGNSGFFSGIFGTKKK